MGNDILIRKYQSKDRRDVRRIVCETAMIGEPCSNFFDGEEIFADALSLYFTDFEPQSCFVAEEGQHVIGYIMGAKDTAVMQEVFLRKIFFRLMAKAFQKGMLAKKKNLKFLYRILLSGLRGEFYAPRVHKKFPAALHINLEKGYRASGVGSRLLRTYLAYLKEEGLWGVHCATSSEKAYEFFLKEGFSLLHQGKRSYYRDILHRDVPVFYLGRSLA